MTQDLDVSSNQIIKLDIPKGTILEDLYSLNLSHNGLARLGNMPGWFPSLTVVDISHNEIMDEDELDFMLHLDTVAEISLQGNDCFTSEESVHKRYPFLEVVNRTRFRPTADRERLQMQEIVQDIRERGLMTITEIKQMQKELFESNKYEHKGLEKIFKNPDGEEMAQEVVGIGIDDEEETQDVPAFNITFKTNAKELEEFASHFEDDFENAYEKIRGDNNQATDTILQTKLSIQEQYKLLGLDGPFEGGDRVSTKCVKLDGKDWKAESRRLSPANSSRLGEMSAIESLPEAIHNNTSMHKYSRLPVSRNPSAKEMSTLSKGSKMIKVFPASNATMMSQKQDKSVREEGTPTTGLTKGDTDEHNKTHDEESFAQEGKPASGYSSSDTKSIFQTKPGSSGSSKQNSFRLRTKSRDQGGVGMKRGEIGSVVNTGLPSSMTGITLASRGPGDSSVLAQKPAPVQTQQRSHKLKMAINWAQKDLKKQNEEILKMIEGSGKDVLSLAQRAPNKLSSIHSASKGT